MPQVHLVDMRDELKEGNRSMFSRQLHEALLNRLERGEQSVLLLNRRGYSTFVMCRSCGYTALCPHCDISLTYHQKSRCASLPLLRSCGASADQMPSPARASIFDFLVREHSGSKKSSPSCFPGIRVIRMDVDTTTEKDSHEKWLTHVR